LQDLRTIEQSFLYPPAKELNSIQRGIAVSAFHFDGLPLAIPEIHCFIISSATKTEPLQKPQGM